MKLAHCIGCRCHDFRACVHTSGLPCSWLRVDYEAGKGVCSACPDHTPRWDAGDRTPAVPESDSNGTEIS